MGRGLIVAATTTSTHAEESAEPASSERSVDQGSEPLAKVLLVEDDPSNRLAVEAILSPLGYPCVRARSGTEALERLLEDELAVILIDVQTPGRDGRQIARVVRERASTREVPILFLTASSRDAARLARACGVGAVDCLVEPIEPELLRSKVSVFVDLWRAKKQLERREATLRSERTSPDLRYVLRTQRVTDAMPCAVLGSGPDGAVYWCNEAYRRYTGLAVDQARDHGFVDAVDPRDRDRLVRVRARAIAALEPFEAEVRLVSRDGASRWFLLRGVPERESDVVVGWIETLTDVDELRAGREELVESLRRANEARDEFIAAASHELRTPLAAAKAQAQLAIRRLRTEPESPHAGKALHTITGQIDRMSKLVDDLLDVSRVQVGRLSLEITEVDLVALVHEVTERSQVLSDRHELRLRVPEGEVLLLGDRGRLDQVITNLVSNAIRYSPDGGPIDVEIVVQPDWVTLSVRDRGIGIPPDKQRQIFEAFGRAHGSGYGGLGLGLTICHGIVARHGGEIVVESSGVPGEGSTFRVRLRRVVLRPRERD